MLPSRFDDHMNVTTLKLKTSTQLSPSKLIADSKEVLYKRKYGMSDASPKSNGFLKSTKLAKDLGFEESQSKGTMLQDANALPHVRSFDTRASKDRAPMAQHDTVIKMIESPLSIHGKDLVYNSGIFKTAQEGLRQPN